MSWGALLGSLVNAGANLYTNSKNQKQARSNLDYQLSNQYKYAQRYALNGPSWAVQGLRKAGLNPILAVSNGVNTGVNIPQASMSSPELKNTLGSDLALLTEAFVAEENAEANKTNAEANKTTAQSNTITAKSNQLRSDSEVQLNKLKGLKVAAETQLLKQDFERNKDNFGFRSNVINDIFRGVSKSVDFLNSSLDTNRPDSDTVYSTTKPHNPYIDNRPQGPDGLKFSEPTKEEKERWTPPRSKKNRRLTIPLSPLPYHSGL